MSSYRNAISEAVKALGLKRVIYEALQVANEIDDKGACQILVHVNSGGISKLVKTSEISK